MTANKGNLPDRRSKPKIQVIWWVVVHKDGTPTLDDHGRMTLYPSLGSFRDAYPKSTHPNVGTKMLKVEVVG